MGRRSLVGRRRTRITCRGHAMFGRMSGHTRRGPSCVVSSFARPLVFPSLSLSHVSLFFFSSFSSGCFPFFPRKVLASYAYSECKSACESFLLSFVRYVCKVSRISRRLELFFSPPFWNLFRILYFSRAVYPGCWKYLYTVRSYVGISPPLWPPCV